MVVRLQPTAGGPAASAEASAPKPLFRSYSLSGPQSTERYRISVKIEPNGAAGTYLRDHVRVGDAVDVSAPRGSFILQSGERPVVLLSAGIGATPVLAMLYALGGGTLDTTGVLAAWRSRSAASSIRRRSAAPRARARARPQLCVLQHAGLGRHDRGFQRRSATCRDRSSTKSASHQRRMPTCADQFRFMAEMKQALAAVGVAPERIHVELFNGSESMTPGVVNATPRAPHLPADDADTGPLVSFARSGIAAHWKSSSYQSLLELAEACDVPVRWSCRTGVCHNCESGLVSGAVVYGPEPLDKPADGNLLVCCSQPIRDVVIDL